MEDEELFEDDLEDEEEDEDDDSEDETFDDEILPGDQDRSEWEKEEKGYY